MDPVINVTSGTFNSLDGQLRAQHTPEMKNLVKDYTRQLAEIAQARDAALAETTRMTRERDAARAASDAQVQRIKELEQALDKVKGKLTKKRTQYEKADKVWEEEKSNLERRCKTLKDRLALSIAAMEKRLAQSEQREEDERKDKKELWNLNEDLIASNRRVEKEAVKAKAAHARWRQEYSAALAEKIDLLHQYAPNPMFPVEVFVNIAGFAAGANDYAGVVAMCVTSRLINAEIKPVLFETLIWNHAKHTRLQQSLDNSNALQFRYTRFVILEDRHFPSFDKCRSRAFPNLRVIIKKERRPFLNTAIFWRHPPECSAELYIFRNTTLGIVSSILRRSLQWYSAGETGIKSCVRCISYIKVAEGATLSMNGLTTDGSLAVEPLQNRFLRVDIPKEPSQGVADYARITSTLAGIHRLIMPPGMSAPLSGVNFRIEDPDLTDLEVWITEVSDWTGSKGPAEKAARKVRKWLLLTPGLIVEVCLRCDDPDTVDFMAFAGRFRAMYEALWQEDIRFHDRDPLGTPFLWLVAGPTPSEHIFEAFLSRQPGLHGFTICIERNRLDVDGDIDDTEDLFVGHYALDGAAWPPADEDGDDNTSDGDSDSSSDMLLADQTPAGYEA